MSGIFARFAGSRGLQKPRTLPGAGVGTARYGRHRKHSDCDEPIPGSVSHPQNIVLMGDTFIRSNAGSEQNANEQYLEWPYVAQKPMSDLQLPSSRLARWPNVGDSAV